MRNLYHIEFSNGKLWHGEGLGALFNGLFQEGADVEDKLRFLFGAAVDAVLFGADVVLETLQTLGAKRAIFFREARGQWTAVRYEAILECPQRTRIEQAQLLFQEVFAEQVVADRPTSKKPRRKKRR